ncbi:MAG: helix-turn-helix domain-containing protein, partial [Magnetococcales bacterium]|nr:helix-turn-helix domain-containing protein [Magnetococcales bacterium]
MNEPKGELTEEPQDAAKVAQSLRKAAPSPTSPAVPTVAVPLTEFGVGAASVGAALRKVRESQGRTLEELARKTRIRASILESIERGATDQLPEEAFTLGFLKLYARQLGLPEQEVAERYRASLKHREEHASIAAPETSRQRPGKWLALLGLGLLGGGYAYHEELLTRWPFLDPHAVAPVETASQALEPRSDAGREAPPPPDESSAAATGRSDGPRF